MSCNHKFQNELRLERVDYEPTTLIVGTFNPAIPGNDAGWFYGRTKNNYLWDVLPRIYGEDSLIHATPDDWRQFCINKLIAFTDIISSIDDADPENKEHHKMLAGASDKVFEYKFEDLNFVNIVQILKEHPSIKHVYLTRGVTEAFWRHLWNPVMIYCNRNGIHERRLLAPYGEVAEYYEAYNNHHPDNKIPHLEDYILMKWREEWHMV